MTGLLLAAAVACADHGVTHQRDLMKHRRTPAVMVANPPDVTVHDVIDWPVQPTAARRADVPVDPREQQVYRLTGYVRLVKLSADDCDIHVQLADIADNYGTAGDAKTQSELDEEPPQVIVEIPTNQPEARAALERIVGHVTTTPRTFVGDDAPRITVTGFAFLDLAHANRLSLWTKEGHGHGNAFVATLWEIHPVFDVREAGR